MQVTVCISGFRDEDLLVGAVESVRPLGWRVAYADGAYELFLPPKQRRPVPFRADLAPREWRGDLAAAGKALEDVALCIVPALERPWSSEAEKKTELAHAVRAHPGSSWTLWLDTDERLETPSGASEAQEWLAANLVGEDVARLLIWHPEHERSAEQSDYMLPRLVRLQPGVTFRPPRDFDVYLGEHRIAWPEMGDGDAVTVPRDILRIRHDRHLRSIARREQSAAYYRRRKAAHGAAVV